MEGTNQIDTLIFIGTGLITLLVLIVLFLAVFYQTHVMKMKRKEAELLLKTSLESEKLERKRIAADIHDGVSGDLNAIRNFLSVLYKSEKDDEKKALFEEIKIGVEAALENTRLVSYKLMPPLLESAGFIVAIQDYFDRINKKTSACFFIHSEVSFFEMSNEVSYELFRVIQEFTTNMIKYGDITKCNVELNLIDDFYNLIITEDGKPYDFKTLYTTSKGTGLKNISSRLKVIEASLKQSSVSTGNQFLISIKKK
ncbi:histidine kinase [Flavobacterium sediminilitoris]|uniref:histidine kinase n=1 Tax=Flavobacterium sediminilitoris TaxID=2024526 RepID=A0ABY4HRV8_9FLAO|nr:MULTISPECIES: histidine kinase [Flavobacterium]UOX35608.1 histidine kinase [Flavobacterium sediminilitoris]